jgi:aminopeptidase
LEKLARVLVDYSVEAREGEQVVVFGEVGAEPLVKAIYARLLQVGAVPVLQLSLPGLQELFFEHARDVHYAGIPSIRRFVAEEADAEIGIKAPSNTRALASVD